MDMIDGSYRGGNNQWYFPAIAMRDTIIHAGDGLEALRQGPWKRGGVCGGNLFFYS